MGKTEIESTLIRCRSCWAEINASELRGSYLNRMCPKCGKRVSEDDLDSAAREICRDIKLMTSQKDELERKACAFQKRINESRLRWLTPLRWWWSRHQAKAQSESEVIGRRLQSAQDELRALAHDRYYVSEWFQCTRIPLVVRNAHGQLDFELQTAYTKGGAFRLQGRNAAASGYEGEFSVFEALRKRTDDPESPLHGARLLPNLFLPHDGSERDMKAGRWNQIDCAIATPKAAFVIEAKRWRARVSTVSSFSQLYVARDKVDGGMYQPAEHVLRQIERTSQVFEKVCPYPEDRIFRVVTFVRPQEFTTDSSDFAGQLLVSQCEADAGPFARAIERKLDELDPILTVGEMNSWADDALIGFGDLYGAYREQANEMRFRTCKHEETHQKRRKGTRAQSARKHQSQKRFRDRKGENKRKRATKHIDPGEWYG